MTSNPRYLAPITAAFCVALVLSNVLAGKLVPAFGLTLTAATFLFPVTYLAGDVLTEVYGYAACRRVIWTGFALQLVATGAIVLALWLPSTIPAQGRAFDAALSLTSWIVLGSLVAYWCGEFLNSFVLARLKLATAGRLLFVRAWASTVCGQAIDTVIFVAVAFWLGSHATGHPLPSTVLWKLVWSVYVVKVAWEVCATPLTYAVVRGLKRAEGLDTYDRGTDWNPFTLEAAGALSDGLQ